MLCAGDRRMKQITSKDNPRYKLLRQLVRSTHARREQNRIVLDGVHLVQAYLAAFGSAGTQLFVKASAIDHAEVAALAAQADTVMLSDDLFDRAAPVESPIGILACAPIPQVLASHQASFVVLLDGIQDPGNLGAVLRAAAATGARAAHLSRSCADPWSPKALRGGMGAQFVLNLQLHDDLRDAALRLDIPLIAAAVDADTSLFEADLAQSVGFVIGAEGGGVSPELIALASQRVRIPMRAGVESLNVASAAAVIFYEWLRRRQPR